MTSIKLIVTGATARAEVDGVLTSGMVGIPVTIEYDSAWDGLTKNLVCKSTSGGTRVQLNVEAASTVPHEVMVCNEKLHYIDKLKIGVEGFNTDGTLVIPTIWAECGRIFPGANSDADPSADPELPIWDQLHVIIPAAAELNEDGHAEFKNSQGVVLFTLDLSGLGVVATYGNLVLSAEELSVAEGQIGTFTVALDKAPSVNQPVYLAVSDGSRLSVEPAVLTFTTENWETPQTVTVTSLEDDDEEDNSVTVTLTSKSVDARQVAVAITDNDVQLEIVTDGLVLSMDYTGHVGDESDTITDPVSGMTFKNFSYFTKLEKGIEGETKYKYLQAVADDAKTAFLENIKKTGGFTLETFGTTHAPCFFVPHYRKLIDSGSANCRGVGGEWYGSDITTSPTRILQDGTTDYTALGGESLAFTVNGTSKRIIYFSESVWQYASDFRHLAVTFSADGDVNFYLNGIKCDNPITVENFKAWDFDTMFGGDFSMLNDTDAGDNFTSNQRIYNRVLTDAEIINNMKVNSMSLELTTF